jgi:hypothetical protein
MINECGIVGGMKIGEGNRSTQRKLALETTLSTINPTLSDLGSFPGPHGGKSIANKS